MAFGSDNQAPVHPKIIEAIIAANEGNMASYSDDEISKKARALISDVFQTQDLDIYFVTTGGAANGIALSAICPPWGAILCHKHSHIIADENNGPEFFTNGARLIGIGEADKKIDAKTLKHHIESYDKNFVHGPQVRAFSFTNLDENGQAYEREEIEKLCNIAHQNDCLVHCDGARLANAIMATKQNAATLSHKSGVDILSFGLTKNGAMMAEAIIVFGAARNNAIAYLQKRAGQLISKSRYLTAQFVAMLEDNLWLDLALHANQMAQILAQKLSQLGANIIIKPMGNEVFASLDDDLVRYLNSKNISFYPWPVLGKNAYRFVCSWNCDVEAIMK